MTLRQTIEFDDRTWSRHANPWSVWAQVAALPLFICAVWSRTWIGAWAVIAMAAVVLWLWMAPRLFPPPRSADSWATKVVLGERIFLDRQDALPPGHVVPIRMTVATLAVSGIILIYGLAALDFAATLLGYLLVLAGKLSLFGRMAKLYEDSPASPPVYGHRS